MRKCRCGCGAFLDDMRVDAVWATEACRQRAQRRPSAYKGRTRRATRDGAGIRLYLTRQDFRDPERLNRKLADARTRLRQKGNP